MSLEYVIKDSIKHDGPISVADYMQLALAHPEHGYYMKKDPLGVDGDFTTAPEISQIFGELVGAWLANQWMQSGKKSSALVELGPGRGTLMHDILRATKHVPNFHNSISVHLVETSPTLKQKQWASLAGKHARIEWHESIDALPDDVPWLLCANEFFDALPIRQFVYQDGILHERMIAINENETLCFATKGANIPDGIMNVEYKESDIIEHCQPALDIATHIATHIKLNGGAALIADYGYASGHGDTLQALKNHKPCDVLETPGDADITAHVDFAALSRAIVNAGVAAHGPVAQGSFLGKLGAIPRAVTLCEGGTEQQQADIITALRRLLDPEQMGELFKVLSITAQGTTPPEGFI